MTNVINLNRSAQSKRKWDHCAFTISVLGTLKPDSEISLLSLELLVVGRDSYTGDEKLLLDYPDEALELTQYAVIGVTCEPD